MQSDGMGQLYDFLYSTFPKFGMSYHIVYLEFYFAMFGAFVGLFTAVGVPDGNCLVVNRVFQSFVIIVLQKAFSDSIIGSRRGAHKRTAVFPDAPVFPGLPVVLRRYFHIVLHIMGILMLKQIYAIFFGQRILHTICNKQQRKMKMLFFMCTSSGVRSQCVRVISKCYRYFCPVQMQLSIQFFI